MGRNLVEATTAGITLDIDDAETVTGVLANTLERGQQAWFNRSLKALGALAQLLFFGTGFSDDLIKFAFLDVEVGAALSDGIGATTNLFLFAL